MSDRNEDVGQQRPQPNQEKAPSTSASAPPPPPPPPPGYSPDETFRTSFGSLSLHMSDRIRVIQFPSEDVDAIRATILRCWVKGIQAERPYSVSREFKLRGNPWIGVGTGPDAVPAQILMRELFACLYERGWIMTASTDISRKKGDKDTLIFRKQPVPPPKAEWMAISFKAGDRLRFLGAPRDLTSAFSGLLASLRLLQRESDKSTAANHHEFKLHGYPWAATGEETMTTRLLILRLVELLELHGWSLYASIDQNNGPAGDSKLSETDCWYCVKSTDWVPGSFIIHR
ncbi:hypothetical protein QQS21_011719 [Conoideocrella luteorostrata]|uniref:Uncharacterized protein n=1 Tax=Conoideocrella luteorostrata TaxID=1105319 RepID=A0AAJ0CCS6_9HYPO|nr:hypothetical protein QQS21_011719 [Conoideocrella luteorostrata]